MKKVTKGIKAIGNQLNVVGEEVKFDVSDGFDKPHSLCATILSIIGIVVISVIGYEFVRQSFDTTNPDIDIELKTLPTYPKIDLEKEKFYFIVAGLQEGHSPFAVEGSRYTITAELSLKIGNFTPSGTRRSLRVRFTNILLNSTRCADVIDKFDFFRKAAGYNPKLLKGSHCFFPPDDIKDQYWVQGQRLDSYFSTIDIKFGPVLWRTKGNATPLSWSTTTSSC